ncbi:ATP-binding response regulator [Syntrophobacter fumaroxidans]|uniref:histidine kinase n=1 Tax=Syntrophobacter fumaroxidans (strain DSM 10017 / MPOB) TaxID=335543 RepID=A0LN82_SYNFM|nr:response regulator [Syntrophobacter fumaroxidans]ABK18884.1 response regulator receiver sensor signal transduction histidine kinase [Syntrophobacter fumaroxidans MPOB]
MNRKTKILVVDDEPEMLSLTSWILDSAGYEVFEASTAAECLESVHEHRPDLVLLDVVLPDLSGLEVCRRIKGDPDLGRTFVVLMSGSLVSPSQQALGLDMGGDGYIARPVASAELLARVQSLVRIKRVEDALQNAYSQLEKRVEERTAELAEANEQLQSEIEERKRTEQKLRRSESQLRFLSSQLIRTQEEERKRIALEVHDSIGSTLTAIKFSLEHIVSEAKDAPAVCEALKTPISFTQIAIEESRKIMNDLRPAVLDDLGISATVGWFCRQFQSIHPAIRIERRVEANEEEIPEPLKIVVFRIMQEAFHNISKHSRADLVRVSLTVKGGALRLTIEDNGVGFNVKALRRKEGQIRRLGLTSMKERTELSGGSFTLKSRTGGGTTVEAFWPKV